MKKILTAIALLLLSSSPAMAQGVLEVDFGDPPVGTLEPVFTVENMMPGDTEDRDITVRNTGSSAFPVILYSQKTEELLPNWPTTPAGNEFSEILEVVINNGSTDIYGGTSGTKTLNDFFSDSAGGLNLGTLSPSDEITYNMSVFFPHSAGNEYQLAKVVFDLMFEQFQTGSIVINEVFYDPDEEHGSDCSSDICGTEIDAEIIENGAGSTNIIDIQINNTCFVVQSNNATVNNSADADADTGDNSVTGNTGFSSIFTGNAGIFFSFLNSLNFNVGDCSSIPNRNDEWIELYNASTETVELDGWMIEDNSGAKIVLDTDEELEPGQFALLSRSTSTWDYWDQDPDAVLIALGTDCGNGLDNDGDHLILYDPDGIEHDFTAWGDDTYRWDPAVPDVLIGHSIERSSPGLDSDSINDWVDRFPPTPGE